MDHSIGVIPYGCPMDPLWTSYGLPIDYVQLPIVSLQFTHGLAMNMIISHGLPLIPLQLLGIWAAANNTGVTRAAARR